MLKKLTLKDIAFIIVCFLFFSVTASNIYKNHFNTNQKIVCFDMKGTINLLIQNLKDKDFDTNEIDKASAKFGLYLDEIIKNYAEKNKVIILVSPAVVAGVDDVTYTIQNELYKKLGY